MQEWDLVFRIGSWHVHIVVKALILASEVDDGVLLITNLALEMLAGSESGWRSRLLENPLNDGVLGSSSGVFHLVALPKRLYMIRPKICYLLEEEESWEALDAVFVGELFVLGGVNLGEGERWVILGQHLSGGSVLGGELLAVSTKVDVVSK